RRALALVAVVRAVSGWVSGIVIYHVPYRIDRQRRRLWPVVAQLAAARQEHHLRSGAIRPACLADESVTAKCAASPIGVPPRKPDAICNLRSIRRDSGLQWLNLIVRRLDRRVMKWKHVD